MAADVTNGTPATDAINFDLAAEPAAQRAGISLNSTPPLALAFFAVSTSDTGVSTGDMGAP